MLRTIRTTRSLVAGCWAVVWLALAGGITVVAVLCRGPSPEFPHRGAFGLALTLLLVGGFLAAHGESRGRTLVAAPVDAHTHTYRASAQPMPMMRARRAVRLEVAAGIVALLAGVLMYVRFLFEAGML